MGAALLFFSGGGGPPPSGTTLWPSSLLIPFELEVIRQPNSQLLFQFIARPTTTVGQPWYLWPKTALPAEPEQVQSALDNSLLFRFRSVAPAAPAYQPLMRLEPPLYIPSEGSEIQLPDHSLLFNYIPAAATRQPWWMWPAVKQPDEPAAIQPIDGSQSLFRFIVRPQVTPQTPGNTPIWATTQWVPFLLEPDPRPADYSQLLFFGRKAPAAPTPGQPFWLWPRFVGTAEPESLPTQPDNTLLHRYRVGYQTVGQPFWTFQLKPGLQLEDQLITQPDNQILFRLRGQIPFSGPTQPFWMWPRFVGSPDAEIPYYDPHSYALFAFRQIYPPPPPVVTAISQVNFGLSFMRLGGQIFGPG